MVFRCLSAAGIAFIFLPFNRVTGMRYAVLMIFMWSIWIIVLLILVGFPDLLTLPRSFLQKDSLFQYSKIKKTRFLLTCNYMTQIHSKV